MLDNSIGNSLFTEKYRPKNLSEYIGNEEVKKKIQASLDKGDTRHLCLFGGAGQGKTTLAKIIANTLDADVLYINASDENNVDTVRNKIKDFASGMGFKTWRIIILDESDFLTNNAQAALRNIIETFSASCRFILTCNYIEKVIDAIKSRCVCYNITPPSKGDVAKRIVEILKAEEVEYTKEDLAKVINANYPDIRAVINVCQDNIIGNKLMIQEDTLRESDYLSKLFEILKSKESQKNKYTECRQIIANSKVRTFEELYSYIYQNINDFEIGKQGDIILFVAEAQYQDSFVVDKEINAMALIINLIRTI